MLGVGLALQPEHSPRGPLTFPAGFDWDRDLFDFDIRHDSGAYVADVSPRDLVDPAIWTGAALHVDGENGHDDNSGFGASDGDFSAAKRTIHAAFTAGNATGAPYRVLVKAGEYSEADFTRNGNEEPTEAVAVIGWGGILRYRAGPFSVLWTAAGDTFTAPETSVKRVFRCDRLTPEGTYSELQPVGDVVACGATPDSWVQDGSDLHVNIDGAPGPRDIAVIRSFNGARFLDHDRDFYFENVQTEGGITGALHFDAVASRNIVGVNCSFGYSAPSNPSSPQNAVRIRRTQGLVAFFDSDASCGAKDGWSFHEDGVNGMHVLLQNCSGWRNGIEGATSCNGFTSHDGVRSILLGGAYGLSRNGTEVHVIQSSQTWVAGTRAVARDVDDTSVAYKCSNDAVMWLLDSVGDAAGSAENYALQANGGTVFTRAFSAVSGLVDISPDGSVTPF